jgi:hypothetical protein
MNARPLLITSLAIGSGLVLSGCTTIARDHKISAAAIAQDCQYQADVYTVADDDPARAGKAPEVMTYDPKTRTETSLDSRDGARVLTVQNRSENRITATAIDAPGAREYPICSASGRDYVYTTYTRSGPNPVIIGSIAGAIVGAATTKTDKGAMEGAFYGGMLGGSVSDPYEANARSIGAATGALIGYSIDGTKGASSAAAYGLILGNQTHATGGATLRSGDARDTSRSGGGGSGGRGGGGRKP